MVAYHVDIIFLTLWTMRRFFSVVGFSILFAACSSVQQPIPTEPTQSEIDMAEAMGITVEELQNQTPEEHMEMMQKMMQKDEEMNMTEEEAMAPRIVTVTAEDWSFTPATILVKKGEKIQLSIEGITGAHGYAIPELGINVGVNPGETVLVDLPTDTAGEFAVRCSVPCGSGHRDMTGTIVIEE